MGDYGRKFNEARKKQGFRSQAHLNAFYAVVDHVDWCAECKLPGGYAELSDGSLQPLVNRCAVAKELDKKSLSHLFTEEGVYTPA